MKKLIKNVLLVFIICFAILNIAGLILNRINLYNMIAEEVLPIIDGEIDNELIQSDKDLYSSYKELYGEDAPSTTLAYFQGYSLGQEYVVEMQVVALIISALLGISIGTIISLTEKSKIKEILFFILIGLSIALLATIFNQIEISLGGEKFIDGFIDDFIWNIEQYGIYYILLYLVGYILRYFIDRNNTKKLNKELQNAKKELSK